MFPRDDDAALSTATVVRPKHSAHEQINTYCNGYIGKVSKLLFFPRRNRFRSLIDVIQLLHEHKVTAGLVKLLQDDRKPNALTLLPLPIVVVCKDLSERARSNTWQILPWQCRSSHKRLQSWRCSWIQTEDAGGLTGHNPLHIASLCTAICDIHRGAN